MNVLAEHPDNANVLFLGTEHALFASTDAGSSWARVPNLPTALFDDVLIHPREKDLVIGTHGSSAWILDDTRYLAEWDADAAAAPLHLFSIRDGMVFSYRKDTSYRGNAEFHGTNPDDGVLITYRIGSGSAGEATLTVRDSGDGVVREMRVPGDAGVHRGQLGSSSRNPVGSDGDLGAPGHRRTPSDHRATRAVCLRRHLHGRHRGRR